MNGYGNTCGMPGFSVDMMTAGHSLQFPTVFFEQPSKIFARNGFQTAMSITLSLAEIGMSLMSTERHPSTAS